MKKIYIVAAIIFFAILIFGLVLNFKKKADNGNLASQEKKETKEQCLARVGKLDDLDLVSEFLKAGVDRPVIMMKYLNCKINNDKNGDNYEKIKNILSKSGITSRKNSKWFNGEYAGLYTSDFVGFPANIALGDYAKLCPKALPIMCRDFFEGTENIKRCDDICNIMSKYDGNADLFREDLQRGQFPRNLAWNLGYRFLGRQAAIDICLDAIPDDQNGASCSGIIEGNFENQKYSCEEMPEKIVDIICSSEIR